MSPNGAFGRRSSFRTGAYLLSKGYDVSGHRRRTVTRQILDESQLVVAISTDHQSLIQRHAEKGGEG